MRLCFFAPLREIECTSLNKIDEVRPVDLVSAKANLDQTYVKSPQNGVIFNIYIRAGEVVSNDGIVELGQINQMYAIVEVYQSDVSKILKITLLCLCVSACKKFFPSATLIFRYENFQIVYLDNSIKFPDVNTLVKSLAY